MIKHVFILLIVFSSINSIYSQNRVIQGKVIYDHDFEPIPYADIIINDSIKIRYLSTNYLFGTMEWKRQT